MENLENPIEVAIKKLAKHAEMQATEIYFNRTVGWSTKLNELMVGIIKTSREAGRLLGISEAEGVVPKYEEPRDDDGAYNYTRQDVRNDMSIEILSDLAELKEGK